MRKVEGPRLKAPIKQGYRMLKACPDTNLNRRGTGQHREAVVSN
jgi:hypothetical protein